jgi:hypothetical protein
LIPFEDNKEESFVPEINLENVQQQLQELDDESDESDVDKKDELSSNNDLGNEVSMEKNPLDSQTQIMMKPLESNYLENELKVLVLTEAEKTRQWLAKILAANKIQTFENSNHLGLIQPRQYQPNYGGNQVSYFYLYWDDPKKET